MKKKEMIVTVKLQRILSIAVLCSAITWNLLCYFKIRPIREFYYATYALVGFFLSFFFLKLIFPELKMEASMSFFELERKEKIVSCLMVFEILIWIVTYVLCMNLN